MRTLLIAILVGLTVVTGSFAQTLSEEEQLVPIASSGLGGDAVPGQGSLNMRISAHADTHTPRPAVLLIHGGEFQSGSADDANMASLEAVLYSAGLSVFSVNYRLAPGASLDQMVHDIQRSVRFIRFHAKEFNLDPDRITLVGDASGGYLALLAALKPPSPVKPSPYEWDAQSDRVQAVVVLSGLGLFGQGVLNVRHQPAHTTDCRFQTPPSCNTDSEESAVLAKAPVVQTAAPPFLLAVGPQATVAQKAYLSELKRRLAAVGGQANELPIQTDSTSPRLWETRLAKWIWQSMPRVPVS